MRRTLLAFSIAGAGTLVVVVAALVGTLWNGTPADDPAPAPAAMELDPEQIYPSLAQPAIPRGTSYRELFRPGHTLASAAKPACDRYGAVRRSWAERATLLDDSSRGAGRSKRSARRYYAAVVWVSQNEAADFEDALSRISRSRLSVATGRSLERPLLIGGFTRDALDMCGLTTPYGRTRQKLARLDKRISGIIALARLDSSGLSDGLAQ